MGYWLGATDKYSSTHEAIASYFTKDNLALTSANILIVGGLMKPLNNLLTKTNRDLRSLDDTIIATELKKKGLKEEDINRRLNLLKEKNKTILADNIIKKDLKISEDNYRNRLNDLKNKIAVVANEEIAANTIKIYDTIYSNSAKDYGVSKEKIMDTIELSFRLTENNNTVNDETSNGDLTNFYQSPYKAPETNIKDFVNKINNIIANNEKIQKQSYFVLDEENNITINTDTLQHTKKHNLEAEDWEDIKNNLNNIVNYSFNTKGNRYGSKNIVLEIKGDRNNYGIVLTGENFNYIKTAFKRENENQWNNWWGKENIWRTGGSFHTQTTTKAVSSIADLIIQTKNIFVKENNPQINNQSNNEKTIKGRTLLYEGKAIIELFKNKADHSTILHESAHYFLNLIQTFADQGNIIAQQQLQTIKEWTAAELEADPKEALYLIQERFARGFEQYIRSGNFKDINGNQKNSFLADVFEYFKRFLERIYETAKKLGMDVNNKQMIEFFDKYLYNPENYGDKDFVYKTNNNINNKEEDNNTTNPKDNDLITLTILKQSEPNEDLRTSIEKRIQELKDKMEDEIQSKIAEKARYGMDYDEVYIKNLVEEEYKKELNKLEFTLDQLEMMKDSLMTEEEIAQEKIESSDYRLIKRFKEAMDERNGVAVSKTDSESTYKVNKQTKWLTNYNEKLERKFEKQRIKSLLEGNGDFVDLSIRKSLNGKNNNKGVDISINTTNVSDIINPAKNNILTEKQHKIVEKLYEALAKMFANEWKEETDYAKEILKRVNEGRQRIIEEAEAEGVNPNMKLYRNVKEMLTAFEEVYEGLNYRQKIKESYKNSQDNGYGMSYNDYEMTYEEYDNIVNFRKKYMRKGINELIEALKEQQKDLEKALSEKQQQMDMRFAMAKTIDDYRQQIKNNEETLIKAGINDINTLVEIKNSMGILQDSNYRKKINDLINNGRSVDFIKKKIREYYLKDTKKAYQSMIDNILLNTTHISKRTGKEYGEVLYEDSSFFSDLKRINKLNKKKATEELIKLTEAKEANGDNKVNTDTQSHYELKKQLLYFRSTDTIEPAAMEKILSSLGNYAKQSRLKLEEIKTQNFYNLLKERHNIKNIIANTKIGNNNLERLTIGNLSSHLGNLPTVLSYMGGKALREKYDFQRHERNLKLGIDKKNNKLLNAIEKIIIKSKKNPTDIFQEWNKPIMKLEVIKPDNNGNNNSNYVKVELPKRITMESLTLELIRLLESKEENNANNSNNSNNKKITADIEFLNNLKNYPKHSTYTLSEYYYNRLKEIIENTNYKNKDVLRKLSTQPYSPIPAYDINTWNLMYFNLLSRNKQTDELLKKYYGNYYETLKNLIDRQSKEFFEIENSLYETVQDRNELNPYYVIEFNRDMGLIENYFPRVSFHEDEINLFDLLSSKDKREKKINAIEHRSANAIPDLSKNPLLLTLRHITQTEYVKHIAVPLKNMMKLFDSQEIKNAIVANRGNDIYNALQDHMNMLKMVYGRSTSNLENFTNYLIGNWAKAVTNTPSVFLKQMTSFMPYMEGINPAIYYKYYMEGLRNLKRTYLYIMRKSPATKSRLEGNKYKDLIDLLRTNEDNIPLDKLRTMNRRISEFIESMDTVGITKHTLTEWGDIFSVVYGGYARIKANMELKHMTEEEALRDFERWTDETQQSSFSSLKPRNRLIKSMESRLGGMFRSQDAQYYQKFLQNIIEMNNGDKTKAEFLANIALYHLATPALLIMVSGLINTLYGRKDKDWWDYTKSYLTTVASSFIPMGLLAQSVSLTFDVSISDLFKNMYKLQTNVFNALGAIFGLPMQAYYNITLNRYYHSPLELFSEKQRLVRQKRRIQRKQDKIDKKINNTNDKNKKQLLQKEYDKLQNKKKEVNKRQREIKKKKEK